ncbi:unnamed protein product, partial [Rotaria magnacalcarata]
IECQTRTRKKKKRPSGQRSSFNIDTSISINQTQSQNETAILSVPSLTSSSSDANPVGARLIPTQNKMNEIDHILDIKNRISKWWSGIDNDNLSLEDGTHYSFPGRPKRTTANATDNNSTNTENQLNSSSKSSSTESKKNDTSAHITMKRARSTSRLVSSKSREMNVKKNRLSSLNNSNAVLD